MDVLVGMLLGVAGMLMLDWLRSRHRWRVGRCPTCGSSRVDAEGEQEASQHGRREGEGAAPSQGQ